MHGQPILLLAVVAALLISLATAEALSRTPEAISVIRDWVPLGLTLVAFQEMEFFVPAIYNSGFEAAWVRWDKILLGDWGWQRTIESTGKLLPEYLELCYLLVYGLGVFCVAILSARRNRPKIDRFLTIYLSGTLLSYALFPFFPSRPPRIVFPFVNPPMIHTALRNVNLFLLRNATIHTGVFPSAHVSSAFAATWAFFLVTPEQRRIAWGLLIYSVSMSLATVYGRYHYVPDVVAGFAISLIAGAAGIYLQKRRSAV